jgi:hypothetical protein
MLGLPRSRPRFRNWLLIAVAAGTGTELVGASGGWTPDELAELSDDKLRKSIQKLSDGEL